VQGDAKSLIKDVSSDGMSQHEQAMGFLRGILHDAPLTTDQVKAESEGAGYAWRTIERAVSEMKEKDELLIKKDTGRTYKWYLL
jgi:putative DNA primase/helicase